MTDADIRRPLPNASSDEKRLEQVFAAVSARVNTEISTYWARNNLLLALNVGLLALGFNENGSTSIQLVMAVVGVSTSVLLFFIIIRGRKWLRYWEKRLIDIEDLLPEPTMYQSYWKLDLKDAIKLGRPRPVTSLVLFVPFVVTIAWLFLAFSPWLPDLAPCTSSSS